MVRKIVWTKLAQAQKHQIFSYWNDVNGSNNYSKKLNTLIDNSIDLIQRFPRIGRPTQFESIRVKILKDYLIIYKLTEKFIYVLSIWDNRQDPDTFNEILKSNQ